MKTGPKKKLVPKYSAEYYVRKIRQMDIPDTEKSIIGSMLWMDGFSDCPYTDHLDCFDDFLSRRTGSYSPIIVRKGLSELGFSDEDIQCRVLSDEVVKKLSQGNRQPKETNPMERILSCV